MEEQLLETWRIHARINLYILDVVVPEALSVSPAKGRTVGQMFAHIHNVRLMWLESNAADLHGELTKIEKDDAGDKTVLRDALVASGQAVEEMLRRGMAAGGKIKGFKPHLPAFVAYLISHEAYHHGEIGMVLTQIGHPLDRKTAYGMWEWGVR
jgi:uncharacterized damage-inducible protein DinB